MKDFANLKNNKSNKLKKKTVFTSKKPNSNTISANTLTLLILISLGLVVISLFLFDTDVISIKSEKTSNTVSINFPTSLMENSVLIELDEKDAMLECEYFVIS